MTADDNKKNLVYDIHVFCCINERESDHPRGSCAARGSVSLHKYMKIRSKELKIKGIRVNKAGCLDRCELGPVLVIYPEAVWYRFDSTADIDEILDRHIIGGETVERLILAGDQTLPTAMPNSRLRLRVEHIKRLTAAIKMFELVAHDDGPLPAFTAGSHIDIFTGSGLSRSYSLANDPAERGRYEIAVLREPDGRGGSAWMHDALALGDVIEATAPKNNFPIRADAARHILIAGGIGITPLLSMGRQFNNLGLQATLHFCTRDPETTAYAKEVKDVFGDQVHFHHDGGDPQRGINLAQVLATPSEGDCLYICGPTGLIEAARKAAAHWPEQSVLFEHFGAAPQDPAQLANDEAFDIILSRQGKTLNVPPGKSILDVIKEAGIAVESGCQEGVCGSCRTRLLGGKAEHRDCFLEDDEKAQDNVIMICSSRAQKGETLILDI